MKIPQPILWGVLGGIGIGAVFYLAQALGMQSWSAPLTFSSGKWYFVGPLIAGFGIQMGLFRAIHLKVKHGGGATVAASGGVSTASMIACCMHNLVSLFPVLGLSGLAVFFSAYQNSIFGISLVFMAGGMVYLFRQYKKMPQSCH